MLNKIKLRLNENFQIVNQPAQALAQYSEAQIILYSPVVLSRLPRLMWITPGNVRIQEQLMWRETSEDTEGMLAYVARIQPAMTLGVGQDGVGIAYAAFRQGNINTSYVKLNVLGSIPPMDPQIMPDIGEQLLMKYNVLADQNKELKDRIDDLEHRIEILEGIAGI